MVKKISFIAIIFVIAGIVVLLLSVFFFPHTITAHLVDKQKMNNETDVSGYPRVFVIKDDKYQGFYDGKKLLKQLLPNYNINTLDTVENTYIVSINNEIKSVNYSGRKCTKRTDFGFPYEYILYCNKEYKNDNMVRIYRIPKVNIDYDYHS